MTVNRTVCAAMRASATAAKPALDLISKAPIRLREPS